MRESLRKIDQCGRFENLVPGARDRSQIDRYTPFVRRVSFDRSRRRLAGYTAHNARFDVLRTNSIREPFPFHLVFFYIRPNYFQSVHFNANLTPTERTRLSLGAGQASLTIVENRRTARGDRLAGHRLLSTSISFRRRLVVSVEHWCITDEFTTYGVDKILSQLRIIKFKTHSVQFGPPLRIS